MNDYILFMHNDAPENAEQDSGAAWEKYFAVLRASGQFSGGSSIVVQAYASPSTVLRRRLPRTCPTTFASKRRVSTTPRSYWKGIPFLSRAVQLKFESCLAIERPCGTGSRCGLTLPSSGHTTAGHNTSLCQEQCRRCVPLMSNVMCL